MFLAALYTTAFTGLLIEIRQDDKRDMFTQENASGILFRRTLLRVPWGEMYIRPQRWRRGRFARIVDAGLAMIAVGRISLILGSSVSCFEFKLLRSG